jgi:cytochrome c-type biogenesis protein CcmH
MRAFTAARLLALFVLSVSALSVSAGLDARAADSVDVYGELENPALQSRYEHITQDLRCLVCQNESIADSNVELAADLRRQVREMLIAGKSDEAIFKFMTDRYGEFVRFNPPVTPKTWLIWGAPFIMVAVGAIVIVRIARQRARLPLDDEPASEIE